MGYYTQYELTIYGPDEQKEQFKKELLDLSKNDLCLKELFDCGYCMAKLYDIRDWITKLAPKYKDLLIVLFGDGEESDDRWEHRWKGRLEEHQDAIIPPFENKELLTEDEKERKNNNNN